MSPEAMVMMSVCWALILGVAGFCLARLRKG
jgi:hypothetical protein